MLFVQKRFIFTEKSTISKVYLADDVGMQYLSYALEDKDLYLENPDNEKVYGQSCIPIGVYELVIDYSSHFKKYLPHLLNVPRFTGVRVHTGNRPEDTEGCVLPGMAISRDWVSHSKDAYNIIIPLIKSSLERSEKVYWKIMREDN